MGAICLCPLGAPTGLPLLNHKGQHVIVLLPYDDLLALMQVDATDGGLGAQSVATDGVPLVAEVTRTCSTHIADACGRIGAGVLGQIFCVEDKCDSFIGYGFRAEVKHVIIVGRRIVGREAEVAAVGRIDRLGDGLAIVRGGLDVVVHLLSVGEAADGYPTRPAVAVAGQL